MTPLVYIMPRGTTQIDDISTWLPPSLHTSWRNVFFEYIKNNDTKLYKYDSYDLGKKYYFLIIASITWHVIILIINHGIMCKLHKITDMSKSKDLDNAKRLCPTTLPVIQVLVMGSINCKLQKIDTIYQANQMNCDHTFRYIAITFIDDNFVSYHTFYPLILLLQVKSCNSVANNYGRCIIFYHLSETT